MKTAIIERYHIFGTPNHEFHILYRGQHIGGRGAYFEDTLQGLALAQVCAKNQGFTQWRLIDESRRYSVKKGQL